MKIFFHRIHLYLGLAAGIVIMVTCLTGAILVFEKELQQLFHTDRYYTKLQGKRISADSLIRVVILAKPNAKIGSVRIYNDPKRTAEVVFTPAPVKTRAQ